MIGKVDGDERRQRRARPTHKRRQRAAMADARAARIGRRASGETVAFGEVFLNQTN